MTDSPKRLFPVKLNLFKPSGKWYSSEERLMVATDCGSHEAVTRDDVPPGTLAPPTAYIHDLIDTIRALYAAGAPLVDGARGDDGWSVVIDGEDVVPHLIKLGPR